MTDLRGLTRNASLWSRDLGNKLTRKHVLHFSACSDFSGKLTFRVGWGGETPDSNLVKAKQRVKNGQL